MGTTATQDLERELEAHRRELTGYCYRMLGSGFEADDAVQETMVRAWRGIDGFEGRSAMRSWLYRIATNVCLDLLRGRSRRARPMDMGPSVPADPAYLGSMLPENNWVQPIADAKVVAPDGDPAQVAETRDTIRLAFVAALQKLPARQRAALILCEVLRWPASETAELLETSVASVNSALQRARATLADTIGPDATDDDVGARELAADPERAALLARYVEAFERYDMDSLVALLRDDVVQSMPPYPMWLEGPDEIVRWMLGGGKDCRGSRMVPTAASGCPAFGQYRADPDGGHKPWAMQVIEVSPGGITGIHSFLGEEHFVAFGLPSHLD
jgi:RNA polymerase sigma-70 factor, ECF subfamily